MDEHNAAAELHRLLSEWEETPASRSTLRHRSDVEGEWWPNHVRAIELLEEVTGQIRRLDPPMPRFENVIERLREGIFGVLTAMATAYGNATTLFTEADLTALEALQHVSSRTPAISAEAATDLLDASRQAEDLVRSAGHLDADAQRYLLELTNHLSKAVQQIGAFGGAEVRRLAGELAGALSAYFGDAPPDEQEQARGLVERMVQGVRDLFVRDFLPAAAKSVGASADQWMLPPGTGS